MSGAALTAFADFAQGTGPLAVKGPRSFVNNASRHKRYSWTHFAEEADGNPFRKIVQGGAKIRVDTFFKTQGTHHEYLPGETVERENVQVLSKIEYDWRMERNYILWNDSEIELNEKIRYGNSDAQFQQFVDIYFAKEAACTIDSYDAIEDTFWRKPLQANMEASGAKQKYSVPVFVNEDTNGLFNPRSAAAWTTVGGITPTAASVNGQWANQTATYSSATPGASGTPLSAFDKMSKKVMWGNPGSHKEYWQSPTWRSRRIYTSEVGHSAIQELLRAGQDKFVFGPQDPSYMDPQFYGVPIEYASALDTAALYNSGSSTTVAESTADLKGPRFYWLDGNHLYYVIHADNYFKKGKARSGYKTPDTWAIDVRTWMNLVCDNRRTQGIISPSADLYYS